MNQKPVNQLIVALWLWLLATTATAANPDTPPTIDILNVMLKTNTIKVRVLRNTWVEARLKDSTGTLRAYSELFIPATGLQDIAFYTTSGQPTIIQPGDTVSVHVNGEEPVQLATAFLDVKPIPEANTILLVGPPQTELRLQIESTDDILPQQFVVESDSQGRATLQNVILRPGMGGFAGYEPQRNRAVIVPFQVPTAAVKIHNDWIEGYVWADREVTLHLQDTAGTRLATTRLLANGEGYFAAHLAEEIPNFRFQPGHIVQIRWEDQQITLPLPQLSIQADPQIDRITGFGPPGVPLSITVYDAESGRRRWYTPLVQADGTFFLDLQGEIDLNANDEGTVFYETPARHRVIAEFRLPRLELTLGSPDIQGRGLAGDTVQVELQDQNGMLRAVAQGQVNNSGTFRLGLSSNGRPVPLAAGDTLLVRVGPFHTSITLPELTVHLDPEHDLITGTAPPNQPVQILLETDTTSLSEEVTTDASGQFLLATGDRADIQAGALATLQYTTPDQHQMTTLFRLPQIQGHVGTQHVTGAAQPHARVTISLVDAAGNGKDAERVVASPRGGWSVDLAMDCRTPALLQAGDQLLIRTSDQEITLPVPPLAVQIDPELDQVSGTAPPESLIWLSLSAADGRRAVEIHVGPEGQFQQTYGPDLDLRAGDTATVEYRTPEGHVFQASDQVPAFSVTLGEATLRGQIPPHTAIQAVLQDSQNTRKGQATGTSDRRGNIILILRDDTGNPAPITAGDRLVIETAGQFYRVEIPPLTLLLDPAGPSIRGTTLPNAVVTLTFVTASRLYLQQTITANSQGQYEAQFDPDIAIRAGDWARAGITTAAGLRVFAPWRAPQLIVHSGSNAVEVEMAPRSPLTILLEDSAGTPLTTGTLNPAAEDTYLFTINQEPVILQPNHRIVVTADNTPVTSLTIPALTMLLDAETSTVFGTGPANGQVSITLSGSGNTATQNATTPIWTDGTYQRRFAGLDSGPGSRAVVHYVDPATGHRVQLERRMGWLRTEIGSAEVLVRATPLSEFTLRLYDAAGNRKGEAGPGRTDHLGEAGVVLRGGTAGVRSASSYASGSGIQPVTVQAGDYLELTTSQWVTGLTVPDLPVAIDIAQAKVRGSTPGQTPPLITLHKANGCTYQRQPTPATDGTYQTDFAMDAGMEPGDTIVVQSLTSAGHQVQIRRQIQAGYLPLLALGNKK